jgi:hypothetical protein
VPFTQTTRSLEADRGIFTLVGLSIFALLLMGWLIWAFTAQFSIYAVSEPTTLRLGAPFQARFPVLDPETVARAQVARLILEGQDGPLGTLPALVLDVEPRGTGAIVQILPDLDGLSPETIDPNLLVAFSQNVTGRVEIETERLSPALLFLRTSGLFADTAFLTSNAQPRNTR